MNASAKIESPEPIQSETQTIYSMVSTTSRSKPGTTEWKSIHFSTNYMKNKKWLTSRGTGVGRLIEYWAKCLAFQSNLQDMWDWHLGHIDSAEHQTELISRYKRPIHSAPFQAGLRTRELRKHEIDIMLVMPDIRRAQTEWTSLVLFAHKKDENPRFCG